MGRIINLTGVSDYEEIEHEELIMKYYEKYKSSDYILAKVNDQDEINHYYIVSPKADCYALLFYLILLRESQQS